MDAAEAARITEETAKKYEKYVNPTLLSLLKLGHFDRVEWEGCGAVLRDLEGREYIDCLGGYGVFSLGHAHPKVVEAVVAQARRLPLSSKTFLNKPLADLSEMLARIAPGDLQFSFLGNSGAEAVEGAMKAARIATGRPNIVSAVGGYHGKTLGALSVSGREVFRAPFQPLLPGVVHVPFGDGAALTEAVDGDTAAVLLEPIQGENGVRIPPDDYLAAARRACDAQDALLILDEVQTGLGRTGKMFGGEHWNVAPDIMTLAKSLGGGVVPIGAFMGTPMVWDKLFRENPLIHTSTFGGNELACAAGIAALTVTIEEDLPAQSAVKGRRLLEGLQTLQTRYPALLTEARGKGLLIGVEFADADVAKLAIGSMVQNGVIVAYTTNNPTVIRVEPPLIISDAQIARVLEVFDGALAEVQALLEELLG